jgi:2-polyprenyl-6-hydroxyphenyl methylase/3-demethylubiquinone-9 3-methyltransferase
MALRGVIHGAVQDGVRAEVTAAFDGRFTARVKKSRLTVALAAVPPRARVLDIGCGLTDLAGRLENYAGCDRNPVILGENRRRFPAVVFHDWDVGAADPPEALQRAGPFDVVLMLALLEHLQDVPAALRRAGSLLAPNGRIVVTTPHPFGKWPLQIGAKLGWLSPHAAEENETLLSKKDLESAGKNASLSMKEYGRFLFGLNQMVVFVPRP